MVPIRRIVAFSLACTACAPVFAAETEKLPPLPEGAFTYCVIPDTQRYLGEGAVQPGRKPPVPTDGPTRNPAFSARVDWIVRNLRRERIFFVSHVGDIDADGRVKLTPPGLVLLLQ